jgi:hypothetical protein
VRIPYASTAACPSSHTAAHPTFISGEVQPVGGQTPSRPNLPITCTSPSIHPAAYFRLRRSSPRKPATAPATVVWRLGGSSGRRVGISVSQRRSISSRRGCDQPQRTDPTQSRGRLTQKHKERPVGLRLAQLVLALGGALKSGERMFRDQSKCRNGAVAVTSAPRRHESNHLCSNPRPREGSVRWYNTARTDRRTHTCTRAHARMHARAGGRAGRLGHATAARSGARCRARAAPTTSPLAPKPTACACFA